MNHSILTDVKSQLGIKNPQYTAFDTDLLVNINAAIGVLNQIGIGTNGFYVEDNNQTWAQFLGNDTTGFQIVKQYIFLKAKVIFDPPTSGVVLESYKEAIKEYEYRLNVMYETKDPEEHVLTPNQVHSLAGEEGGAP